MLGVIIKFVEKTLYQRECRHCKKMLKKRKEKERRSKGKEK
jgi:hypothetical protein